MVPLGDPVLTATKAEVEYRVMATPYDGSSVGEVWIHIAGARRYADRWEQPHRSFEEGIVDERQAKRTGILLLAAGGLVGVGSFAGAAAIIKERGNDTPGWVAPVVGVSVGATFLVAGTGSFLAPYFPPLRRNRSRTTVDTLVWADWEPCEGCVAEVIGMDGAVLWTVSLGLGTASHTMRFGDVVPDAVQVELDDVTATVDLRGTMVWQMQLVKKIAAGIHEGRLVETKPLMLSLPDEDMRARLVGTYCEEASGRMMIQDLSSMHTLFDGIDPAVPACTADWIVFRDAFMQKVVSDAIDGIIPEIDALLELVPDEVRAPVSSLRACAGAVVMEDATKALELLKNLTDEHPVVQSCVKRVRRDIVAMEEEAEWYREMGELADAVFDAFYGGSDWEDRYGASADHIITVLALCTQVLVETDRWNTVMCPTVDDTLKFKTEWCSNNWKRAVRAGGIDLARDQVARHCQAGIFPRFVGPVFVTVDECQERILGWCR